MKIDMSGIEELAQGFNPASLADRPRWSSCSQGVFEPKATPEQTAALERLETMLALIEGWVQTVVTAALGDRIPGTAALSEMLRAAAARTGEPPNRPSPRWSAWSCGPQDAGAVLCQGADRGGRRRRLRRGMAHPDLLLAPPT
jgi:hypothetical protein